MQSRPDSAISESIGTILMVFLIVVLAGVTANLLFGISMIPQKPVLAAFSADVVMGANATSSYSLDVPTIRLTQMAGDTLSQEYSEGSNSAIAGTKMKIIDPTGKMYTPLSAISLQGEEIKKGTSYYIFHYKIGGPDEYWLTNDPARIYDVSQGGGVLPFSPPRHLAAGYHG
jgi:FlaG/FlaF family flagellin (archaellin)